MKRGGVLQPGQGLCTGISNLIVPEVEIERMKCGGVFQPGQGLCTSSSNLYVVIKGEMEGMKCGAKL